MKIFCLHVLLIASLLVFANTYSNRVSGYGGSFDDVEVIIESRDTLLTTTPDQSGNFTFNDLKEGDYFIKVNAEGYKSTPARRVNIPSDSNSEEPYQLDQLADGPYIFHWEEDQSTAGFEYSAQVNRPLKIKFLDEDLTVVDNSGAVRLQRDYNFLLIDNDRRTWSQEHAYRLYRIMSELPLFRDLPSSRWELSSEELENDIQFSENDDSTREVLISNKAFVNANPRIVEIEGRRGTYYSKRLHHAVVRYITNHGTRNHEKILNERFGVNLNVRNYDELTKNTTNERASAFQKFHPEEIIQLINMLEEMPSGFHKIPELKYIVRRLDGTPHPLYPEAPAVAWPTEGYIEFMDSAFLQTFIDDIHRLIIHEKSHFLWEHLFDENLRDDWIELGGWYPDSTSSSGWSTTQTTQFVSAYGHLKNPNEDMAESIADFVVNPDILRSRAIKKYEFIRDRIMQGRVYISQIREDLTFEVYNLYPDYVFPGKIKRVDVKVEGEPNEEKEISVEVELHAINPDNEGAKWALSRIVSDIDTYFDLYLYPRDTQGRRLSNGLVLNATKKLNPYMKAGYWLPTQIVLKDGVGNSRYQRTNSFGWQLYMDNPKEDYLAPEYIPNSLDIRKSEDLYYENNQEYEVQNIHVDWEVKEDSGMDPNWACLSQLNVDLEHSYRFQKWGKYENNKCYIKYIMPDYMPATDYTVVYLLMKDQAQNSSSKRFLSDGQEELRKIFLETDNPDTTPPEININQIEVSAEPTNPDNPDGETNVKIVYRIRDDISGFRDSAIRLRDPQGLVFFRWHLGPDRDKLFTSLPKNEWYTHTLNWILPAGSAPGTWGVTSITTYDRAKNTRRYDFTETVQIEVQNHSHLAKTNFMMMRGAGFIVDSGAKDTPNAAYELLSELESRSNDVVHK